MTRTIIGWTNGVLSPSWLEREGKPCDDAGRVAAVLAALDTYTLMPSLAGYAYAPAPNDPGRDPGLLRLFGNFVEVSGGFQIDTDDPDVIARYNAGVRSNVNTARYRAAKLAEEQRHAAKGRR